MMMDDAIAEANARAIMARAGPELGRLVNDVVQKLMESQAPKERKYFRLTEIADQVGALIAPNTPCRRGCSACCYQAVGISDTEARRIAAHIGRPLVAQPHAGDLRALIVHLGSNVERFRGVPCTFLGAEGECTIYPVRPIACRTHHSLAADAAPCDTATGSHDIPHFNLQVITIAAGAACIDEAFADIRQYFPAAPPTTQETPAP